MQTNLNRGDFLTKILDAVKLKEAQKVLPLHDSVSKTKTGGGEGGKSDHGARRAGTVVSRSGRLARLHLNFLLFLPLVSIFGSVFVVGCSIHHPSPSSGIVSFYISPNFLKFWFLFVFLVSCLFGRSPSLSLSLFLHKNIGSKV